MLYRVISKKDTIERMEKLRHQYQDLYKKHNINIIGIWWNAEDESESFYLARYENEDTFNKQVKEKLWADETYKSLVSELEEVR
jgi:hypothetical protein